MLSKIYTNNSVIWYICLCLPPDRTWHKVNEPKVDYSGDLEERKVGHEPRLEPCWTKLVIDPQCNVGLMILAGLGPKSGFRHVCLIIGWTGQQSPVQYKSDKGVNDAARPPGSLAEARGLLASSLPWSIDRPARMPDSPLKRLWLYGIMYSS